MIYLIKTVYGNEETREIYTLLKIGYSSDINKRFLMHKGSNPNAKLIATRNGDEN